MVVRAISSSGYLWLGKLIKYTGQAITLQKKKRGKKIHFIRENAIVFSGHYK